MNPKLRSTVMKLQLDLLCFYLLCFTGKTLCEEKGPAAIKVLVSEGSDVTLPCSLSTKENIQQNLFDWRKDDGMTGVFMYDKGLHHNNSGSGQAEQFKWRVFHFQDELKHGNASIIIRNTKVADSGEYTCFFPLLQTPQIFHIDLVVVSSPKPSVTILDATDDGTQLQCEVHGASPKPKVEWKDSAGNKLPAEEPQVTDRGGSYDIILQTTVTETDRYRCVVTQEEINHQTYTEIYVAVIVSSPKPSITILDATVDWMHLRCEVHGASPKPKVEWKDSAGNKLPAVETLVTERRGSYDIILQTTLKKTDRYRCVVTQEEINHQTYAEIDVHVCGDSRSIIIALSILLAAAVLVIFGLVLCLCCHRPNDRIVRATPSPFPGRSQQGSEGSKIAKRKKEQQSLNTGSESSKTAERKKKKKKKQSLNTGSEGSKTAERKKEQQSLNTGAHDSQAAAPLIQ